MVEYKASLKLKIPRQDNIMGLSWESYEVINCNYTFNKKTNHEGEVCSSLRGGLINLELSDLPTDNLMGWVFDHAKRYNGEITIFDTDQETIEQIYFEDARCIDFRLCYKADKKPHTSTNIILATSKLQIGDVHYENLNR